MTASLRFLLSFFKSTFQVMDFWEGQGNGGKSITRIPRNDGRMTKHMPQKGEGRQNLPFIYTRFIYRDVLSISYLDYLLDC